MGIVEFRICRLEQADHPRDPEEWKGPQVACYVREWWAKGIDENLKSQPVIRGSGVLAPAAQSKDVKNSTKVCLLPTVY